MSIDNGDNRNNGNTENIVNISDDHQPLQRISKYMYKQNEPYAVYMRSTTRFPLPIVELNKYMYDKYKSILYIKPFEGSRKLKILCKDLQDANLIVCDNSLKENYRVYILSRLIEIRGVITVGLDVKATEIFQNGIGKFNNLRMPGVKILEVHRNTKVVNNDVLKLNSMRITFAGTILPDFVELGKMRLNVRLYEPSCKPCPKCFNFGHPEKFCGETDSVCIKCGKLDHDLDNCIEEEIKCLNCGENHITGSDNCRVILKKKEKEKNRIIKKSYNTYAEVLASLDGELSAGTSTEIDSNDVPVSNPYRHRPKVKPARGMKRVRNEETTAQEIGFSNTNNIEENHESSLPLPKLSQTSRNTRREINNSEIKPLIMDFINDLELPSIVVKVIEMFLIPIVEKVWKKIVILFNDPTNFTFPNAN